MIPWTEETNRAWRALVPPIEKAIIPRKIYEMWMFDVTIGEKTSQYAFGIFVKARRERDGRK